MKTQANVDCSAFSGAFISFSIKVLNLWLIVAFVH